MTRRMEERSRGWRETRTIAAMASGRRLAAGDPGKQCRKTMKSKMVAKFSRKIRLQRSRQPAVFHEDAHDEGVVNRIDPGRQNQRARLIQTPDDDAQDASSA